MKRMISTDVNIYTLSTSSKDSKGRGPSILSYSSEILGTFIHNCRSKPAVTLCPN